MLARRGSIPAAPDHGDDPGKASKMRNTITRNSTFGTLQSAVNSRHITSAQKMLFHAIEAGELDAPYVDVDKKHRGSALNYDIFDAKDGIALYQRRYTVCSKYGNSPKKDYFLLHREGRKVSVEWLDGSAKARVVKLAKASTVLGEVINTLTGVAKRPLKAKSAMDEARPAFKIIESRDGCCYSVFDKDHEWPLGKTQVEAASPDHEGGFYVFETEQDAMAALAKSVVFNAAWQEGKKLALVRCLVSGKEYRHDNGKLCVSRCKPTKVVRILENSLA